jgi:hypothetical protein
VLALLDHTNEAASEAELIFDALEILQVNVSGDWQKVLKDDQARQKRIRGHSIVDFKTTLTQRIKQHVANQREV